MSELKTREEAIAWFVARGWGAKARTWSMGATITIPMGKASDTGHADIQTYPGMVTLYPEPDGGDGWRVTDYSMVDRGFPNLSEATLGCYEFIEFMRPWVRTQQDPTKRPKREQKFAPCNMCGKQLPLPAWKIIEGSMRCLDCAEK